jgi:hypothetical protein
MGDLPNNYFFLIIQVAPNLPENNIYFGWMGKNGELGPVIQKRHLILKIEKVEEEKLTNC